MTRRNLSAALLLLALASPAAAQQITLPPQPWPVPTYSNLPAIFTPGAPGPLGVAGLAVAWCQARRLRARVRGGRG